jgi:chaperonin GroES
MHFRPLHDRGRVRGIDAEERTAGGILIPDTAKRSRRKVRLSRRGPVRGASTDSFSRLTSKLVIGCCSANGPAPRSRSTFKTTSS